MEENIRGFILRFFKEIFNKKHLIEFFRSEDQIMKISKRLAENLIEFLKNPDNEKLKYFFSKIINYQHTEYAVPIEDTIDGLEILKESLRNYIIAKKLGDVDEKNLERVFEFLKNEIYKSYTKRNLKTMLFKWNLFKETLPEFAEIYIDVSEKLLKCFDNKEYCSQVVMKKDYMKTLRYSVESYISGEISNMAMFIHKKFEQNVSYLLYYLRENDYQNAYTISEILLLFSSKLLIYLLYIHYNWQLNKENALFKFITDPAYLDNVVSILLIPHAKTQEAIRIFKEFSRVFVRRINSSENSKIFAFEYFNDRKKIYRTYVIYIGRNFEKEALPTIKKVYENTRESIQKKYALIKGWISDYISLISFTIKNILEKFNITVNDISVFVDIIEEKKFKNFYILKEEDYIELVEKTAFRVSILKAIEKIKEGSEENIKLYLQPIVSLKDNKVFAYEVLTRIRVNDKEVNLGRLKNFIKEYDAEIPFDKLVLKKMFAFCGKDLRSKGLKVAINLFPESYFETEIVEIIEKLNSSLKANNCSLILEIVEDFSYDLEYIINRISHIPIEVALDDFGTGYSNFGKLVKLFKFDNFKYIKIDECLTKNMKEDVYYREVVDSIVNLARKFNKVVVFEHIESKDLFEELKAYKDVALAQGFFFGSPKPVEKVFSPEYTS